jgi:peptide/nickel transport system permease protein
VLYAALNVLGFRPFNRIAALQYELWSGEFQPFQIWWKMLGTLAVLAGVVLLAMKLAGNPPRRRVVARVSAIAILPVSLGLWFMMGIGPWAVDLLAFLSFPVLVLFLVVVGDIVLVMAAAMDGTASSDFVTAARAKGLSEKQVRDRHAGRVALLPALSRLTAALPFALGGIVIIEASFGALGGYRIPIPGMSSVLFGSLRQRNVLLTLGGLVVVGVITLLVRIGLDIAIAVLDPRVKMEGEARV